MIHMRVKLFNSNVKCEGFCSEKSSKYSWEISLKKYEAQNSQNRNLNNQGLHAMSYYTKIACFRRYH